MRADNSHHVIAAARRRMDATAAPISFDAVAREARVSRSWLYTQPDLRAEIERLRARQPPRATVGPPPDRQRASDASLLRRLEVATARLRQLEVDNRELRDALSRALGDRRADDVHGRAATRREEGRRSEGAPLRTEPSEVNSPAQ
jgi:hypothetical protein